MMNTEKLVLSLMALMPFCNFSAPLMAEPLSSTLPTGQIAIHGDVNFSQTGNTLDVNSSSAASIVHYDTFSIGSNATVNFNLPDANSAILNRVVGTQASEIYGNMTSNGNVFLVNTNGIIFGQGSQVNVNGLMASTMELADQDFLNGEINLTLPALVTPIAVINEGNINANWAEFNGIPYVNIGEFTPAISINDILISDADLNLDDDVTSDNDIDINVSPEDGVSSENDLDLNLGDDVTSDNDLLHDSNNCPSHTTNSEPTHVSNSGGNSLTASGDEVSVVGSEEFEVFGEHDMLCEEASLNEHVYMTVDGNSYDYHTHAAVLNQDTTSSLNANQ